jgi:hypothetical protein
MASIAFGDILKTRNKKHPVLRRMFFVATISLLCWLLGSSVRFFDFLAGISTKGLSFSPKVGSVYTSKKHTGII